MTEEEIKRLITQQVCEELTRQLVPLMDSNSNCCGKSAHTSTRSMRGSRRRCAGYRIRGRLDEST